MNTAEFCSRSYGAIIDRLYEASGGARFDVSRAQFSAALCRACLRRFTRGAADVVEVQQFLDQLHVADLALALACRAGNEVAWRQFHDTHHATVERCARGLARDPIRAQELADTLWGDLYGHAGGRRGRASPLDHYHSRSALGPWLRAVMARRNANAWRQSIRRSNVESSAIRASSSIDASIDRPPDPDRAGYLAMLGDVLGREVDQVANRDRRRLSLYYVKGYSLAKIGALMGEHESTVSRNLLRTRRDIRRQVERRLRREHRLTDDQLRQCIDYATGDWPLDLAGAFIGELRHGGLDVVLVIDCAGSMRVIIREIKARMMDLIDAIQRLVPIARAGIVLFAGKGEMLQVHPLTRSPDKARAFLENMIAIDGSELPVNTLGGCNHAVAEMAWKPRAKKVIVLVGDAPPPKDDWAPMLALVSDFRIRNGTFNAIDVAAEEHERFEREYWMKLHGEEPPTISPLPEFYRQAQAAYQTLATTGGGTMRSLSKTPHINYQVLILAFGAQWQSQVAAYGKAIDSGAPRAGDSFPTPVPPSPARHPRKEKSQGK